MKSPAFDDMVRAEQAVLQHRVIDVPDGYISQWLQMRDPSGGVITQLAIALDDPQTDRQTTATIESMLRDGETSSRAYLSSVLVRSVDEISARLGVPDLGTAIPWVEPTDSFRQTLKRKDAIAALSDANIDADFAN